MSYAAIFPSQIISGALPKFASIFTAELFAILAAIQNIFSMTNRSYIIYSDSASSLQALESFNPKNPLVQRIQLWLYSIAARNKQVSFCWLPGHIGIAGNETADAAAKKASTEHPIHCRLPYSDFKAGATRCGKRLFRMLASNF